MENLFKRLRSCLVIHYFQPQGGGAISRDFTTNLAPRCKAFSRALTPTSFSPSVHSLLPKQPFKNIFDFTTAGDWD